MSTIDVNNDQHRSALRWACELDANTRQLYGQFPPPASIRWPGDEERVAAVQTITDPRRFVALTRDLLAWTGVDVHEHSEPDWDGECDREIVVRFDGKRLSWNDYNESFDVNDVTRLIRALLDVAPGNRDGAIRALREMSR